MSDSQDVFDDSRVATQSQASSSRKRKRALTTAWTQTQASKLVLLIKAEERLWNSFHPDYKNFKASRMVWDKIAKQMERQTDDCLNKWGSLRCNFKARHVDKSRNGGEVPTLEDLPKPYCYMGFLMEVLQKKPAANDATDSSSISETNDGAVAEESFEDVEIVNPLYPSSLSSQPTPKRRSLRLVNLPMTSTLQKEAMLGVAFERMMKPEDEWDKTANALAEHMRNAVNEFPQLADRFRIQLLEVSLGVQKERANAREESRNFFKTEWN